MSEEPKKRKTKKVMSCLTCSYRVEVPRNKDPNDRVPSCCFHNKIEDNKDMTQCDLYTEFKPRHR